MRKFDQLNVLKTYPRIDYEEYFHVLDIPEEDKEKRIELAEQIDDVFDWLFSLVVLMVATQQTIDTEYLIVSVQTRLMDLMDVNVKYVSEHIVKVATETVETTVERREDAYYTSEQRASEIAADEAHTFFNYEELQEAWDSGKTRKTWNTRQDKRVRETHAEVEGVTIPIEEPFQVGDYEMMVPHDSSMGAGIEELAGCRCWATYS